MIPKSYGTKPAPNRNVEKPATPCPVWNFDVPEDVLRASREEQGKLAFKGPSGESGPQRTNLPNLPLAPVAVDRLSVLPRPILGQVLGYGGLGGTRRMVETSRQLTAQIRKDPVVDGFLAKQAAAHVARTEINESKRVADAKDATWQTRLNELQASKTRLGEPPKGLFKDKARAKHNEEKAKLDQQIHEHKLAQEPRLTQVDQTLTLQDFAWAQKEFQNRDNKHETPAEPLPKSTVELPPAMKNWFTPPDDTN